MKIGVVGPSPVPFVLGGAERAQWGLVEAINQLTDHDAELIKLPSREATLPELIDSYRRFADLDVSHFDLVVTCKYPAWMINHPNHTVYVFHRLRGLYDTYDLMGLPRRADHSEPEIAALQALVRGPGRRAALAEFFDRFHGVLASYGPDHAALAFPGPVAREIVHWLDGIAFAPGATRRYVALSKTVAGREGYFPPGARVAVAYLPATFPERAPSPGGAVFTASRLDGPKRIDLVVGAMRHVQANVELRVAGTGPQSEALRRLAGDDPRITFLGHLSDAELQDEYSRALAVPFVPAAEDYGLVVVEAQRFAKPVITCTDSGGPTELVESGHSGFVVEPRPEAIGRAIDQLATDPSLVDTMGRAGQVAARAHTWEKVIDTLTGDRDRPARRPGFPKLVVTSTFPVYPPQGGGQLRCFELYGAVTDRFDVEIVSLLPYGARSARHSLGVGFAETQVPRSRLHAERELELDRAAGIPVGDIVAAMAISSSPDYIDALRSACADAMGVILAHPYLEPALVAAGVDLPVAYDAHNFERQLKADMLPDSPVRDELLEATDRVERAAVERAAVIATCSSADADGLASRYRVPRDRIIEIPNGAPISRIELVTGPTRRAHRDHFLARLTEDEPARAGVEWLAAFVASWHEPNIVAARFIVEIAPSMPEMLFVLAGGHSKAFREVPPNVVPLGIVSDATLCGLLRSVDIALNPMVTGGGSNLKLIEYLAHGAPVVTTPLGVRGYDLTFDEHLCVAELAAFRTAIRGVLADPSETEARSRRARTHIESRYDWTVLGTTLSRSLTDLVG